MVTGRVELDYRTTRVLKKKKIELSWMTETIVLIFNP